MYITCQVRPYPWFLLKCHNTWLWYWRRWKAFWRSPVIFFWQKCIYSKVILQDVHDHVQFSSFNSKVNLDSNWLIPMCLASLGRHTSVFMEQYLTLVKMLIFYLYKSLQNLAYLLGLYQILKFLLHIAVHQLHRLNGVNKQIVFWKFGHTGRRRNNV